MELILLPELLDSQYMVKTSFNPCFIGTYSFTYNFNCGKEKRVNVLILVLLELILLLQEIANKVHLDGRFNPCFIGTYSFT